MNFETPDADAADQAKVADDAFEDHEPLTEEPPAEADQADAMDQQRVVPIDDAYDEE
jgi:hypothetical protein